LLKRNPFVILAALSLAATSLGGCTAFKQAVGIEKVVPDDESASPTAPLAIPPDFALRPTRAGAQGAQDQTPTDPAHQTVFRAGETKQATLPPAADQRSTGEGDLLKAAGVAGDQSNIRDVINTESVASGELTDTFIDRLAYWRKPTPGSPSDATDPVDEAARPQAEKTAANVLLPAPASLAGKPTIERTKSSSWFGSLFRWLF
jgi:Protein of unknown function (DUF3035)